MEKGKRQQKILSLIQTQNVGTQQELAALLERAGVVATQSSISRDLVELGIVKRNGHYATPQAGGGPTARGLLAVAAAGDNLLVAKCEPGLASAVAVEIDRAHIGEITGRSPARTRSSSPCRTRRRGGRRRRRFGSCFSNRSQETGVRSQKEEGGRAVLILTPVS